MHKKRLSLNTISSLMLEITTVICGLILPRLIIKNYGSDVNGLLNSIRQFLAAITFLEFGMGAVIRSSLYKPLADKNMIEVSKIVSSASRFFRKVALVLFGYVIFLVISYPLFIESNLGRGYISLLIVVMSAGSFSQYLLGFVDVSLLASNQRGYIQAFSGIIATLLNTLLCVVFISYGFSIHVVQLTTAVIYAIRPILIRLYVKRHYSICYKMKYEGEPISQKWNGVAQHIAYVILEGTDIIVLTAFSSLTAVSVYSVYHLVIAGIKQLFNSICEGFQALFGEYYATNNMDGMTKTFDFMEWLYGTGTTFVYGCTLFLIVPFVSIYTMGINDTNYRQPLFAIIIVSAYWVYSNNLPYHVAILAAGHYRQTQKYFMTAAAINVLVSITTVNMFGLIGVAIGTLMAMIFQTGWMIIYNIRHISMRPPKKILRQFVVDGLIMLVSSIISATVKIHDVSWIGWLLMAVKIALIWGTVSLVVNVVFFRDLILSVLRRSAIRE